MNERLEEIKANWAKGYDVINGATEESQMELDFEWLIDRVQELEKDRDALEVKIDKVYRNKHNYKQALEQITQLGWSDDFGGGHNYMGEYHAQAIKISEKALEREG